MIEKDLPLFPLNLVVFPGETLNLHIFEPRYQQLVREALATDKIFGIPSFVLNKIEYGTEVRITKLEKMYEDGRMDIRTQGTAIFKVLDFVNPLPGKLYAGGTVELMKNAFDGEVLLQKELYELANELFEWLGMQELVHFDQKLLTYTIAHKIGLSKEQEFELLKMASERERQEFLIGYLKLTIPIVKRMERAKEKIRQNGHFKHMDPLDF